MIFNVWTFLFQVVNFLVMVAVLRWLLYRPLREAIDRRREANARASADAEAARHQAMALQQELDQKLAEVERERTALLREARERAEADRQTLLSNTEEAIRHRRDEVERQIAHQRDEAMRSIRGELVHSAAEMARRILREAADTAIDDRMAARLIAELAQIPDVQRQQLREEWEDGEPAVIESAAHLNGEAMKDLKLAIETLAGRPMGVSVRLRPELLGGVRLRIGGHVWDASMAGPLEELESTSGPSTEALAP